MTGSKWSVKMADSIMVHTPVLGERWNYENGVVLKGFEEVWRATGNQRYFDYIKGNMDQFVCEDGSIRSYDINEYNLDQVNSGKLVLTLYLATGEEKYKKAAYLLMEQLSKHPRTKEGVFWHKKIYPWQIWLDGLYMASPFYAEFLKTFGTNSNFGDFDDVVKQFIIAEKNTRDPNIGLLYHGWDESRHQKWAHPDTGCSPNFWGRAMGWYMMAMVDVLDHIPSDYPGYREIISILGRLVPSVIEVQDKMTGLWYQVLDKGWRQGNYLEASASCMFVYAISKGVKQGYIDKEYSKAAIEAYQGIVKSFIKTADDGRVVLKGICKVAGLGRCAKDQPYRDGSFSYYIGEPVVSNDYKGMGPFIMASSEIERLM